MRAPIIGGFLAIVAAGVALAAVGTAGAQGGGAPLVDLIDTTQQQLGRLAAVQAAAGKLNLVRATGGLAGLGVGIAVGSIVTYLGWRR